MFFAGFFLHYGDWDRGHVGLYCAIQTFGTIYARRTKSQAGLNSYKISVKEWVEKTNAIGLMAKAGRYGGTYAHKEIAFEFGMWISPEFKIYLVKEFQRLKEDEQKQLGWDIKRNLARINYRIHTDAAQSNLIPPELTAQQIRFVYANEADVLNAALFGMTAKQGRDSHPEDHGNIRDHVNAAQLVCLSNLENLNALLIADGLDRKERLVKLNQIAIRQMELLTDEAGGKRLGNKRRGEEHDEREKQ